MPKWNIQLAKIVKVKDVEADTRADAVNKAKESVSTCDWDALPTIVVSSGPPVQGEDDYEN